MYVSIGGYVLVIGIFLLQQSDPEFQQSKPKSKQSQPEFQQSEPIF